MKVSLKPFYKIVFYSLIIIISSILFSCDNKSSSQKKSNSIPNRENFVYIENNVFKVNDTLFEPIMVNYVISCFESDNEFLLVPFVQYEDVTRHEYNTKDSLLWQLKGHFRIAKEIGFNTIRLCMDRLQKDESTGKFYFPVENNDKRYYVDKDGDKIIAAVRNVVNCASEAGVRLMLLLPFPLRGSDLTSFTEELLKELKDEPTIFAYDMFNEPLYFYKENPFNGKKTIEDYSKELRSLMVNNAPYQLYTIGFAEPIEAFLWDPNIMDIDFVTCHPYNPLRFASEVYWYGKYLNKPWMLGETGFHTDTLGTYAEMSQYIWETMHVVKDNGGLGYALWEFQDVLYNMPGHTHYGILNTEGRTTTSDGDFEMIGSLKPASKLIPLFHEITKTEPQQPPTYFNMVGYKNFVVKGRIVDSNNKPISGAVIRGWNKYWAIGANTYSDDDGYFTLYSNDEFIHFCISALGYSTYRFDKSLDYYDHNGDKVNLSNLDLPDKDLEYQYMNFRNYLKDTIIPDSLVDHHILVMDTTLFNQYKYEGSIKNPIKLNKYK